MSYSTPLLLEMSLHDKNCIQLSLRLALMFDACMRHRHVNYLIIKYTFRQAIRTNVGIICIAVLLVNIANKKLIWLCDKPLGVLLFQQHSI